MKILLVVLVIQFLNPLAFIWFNRTAGIRILALRQQLVVYKRNRIPRLFRIFADHAYDTVYFHLKIPQDFDKFIEFLMEE